NLPIPMELKPPKAHSASSVSITMFGTVKIVKKRGLLRLLHRQIEECSDETFSALEQVSLPVHETIQPLYSFTIFTPKKRRERK
ncbi:MAG: hypothetical protein CW716_07150, partial [Candidatus Bathyarchaeum sp.]